MNSEPVTIELYPYRSLSRNGFILVMAIVSVVSALAGVTFLLLGAWPVIGFFGLDVWLIWWAFRRNYSDAARKQTIHILPDDVTVVTSQPGKTALETHLPRAWIRVDLEQDLERELIGKLRLSSRTKAVEIGNFLAPCERQSLASALRAALAVT